MKILCWNVNGIRAAQRRDFEKTFKKENPDILCIQETKATQDQVELDVNGYDQYWNSAIKKGYSGTAIFTKIKPKKVLYDIGVEEHDKEGRVLALEFDRFYLVNVYVPNSGRELLRLPYRQTWDKDFLSYLKKLEKKKPVVVCGDFNVAHTEIDLKNPKSNYNKTAGYCQEEIDGFDNLIKSGFVDTFREFNKEPGNYSFWSYRFNAREKNAGWRIDYFLVSKDFMKNVKESFIMPQIMGSDHCPVGIVLKE